MNSVYPLQVNIPFPICGGKKARNKNKYPQDNIKVKILVLRLRLDSLSAPNYNLFDSGTTGVDRLGSA